LTHGHWALECDSVLLGAEVYHGHTGACLLESDVSALEFECRHGFTRDVHVNGQTAEGVALFFEFDLVYQLKCLLHG